MKNNRLKIGNYAMSIFLLGILFLIGLSILLYPYLSSKWNDYRASQLITRYDETVASGDEETYEEERELVEGYNETLVGSVVPDAFAVREDIRDEEYESYLNIAGDGIMGYIDIPAIDVAVPIYHYANKESLEKGVGHLNGSSLPIGGENTHCVLTGHRGMPNAKLFTDLNLLKEGNRFYLKVLNETLVYEVYEIETVLPDDTDSLAIVEGQDLCTLITCTPYGVNTHRLLVHAKRVYEESGEAVADSKVTIQDRKTSILIQLLSAALGAYIAVLFLWFLKRRNRRRQERNH